MSQAKIIFVEDDAALLDSFTELLTARGFSLEYLSSSVESIGSAWFQ